MENKNEETLYLVEYGHPNESGGGFLLMCGHSYKNFYVLAKTYSHAVSKAEEYLLDITIDKEDIFDNDGSLKNISGLSKSNEIVSIRRINTKVII